MLRCRKGKSGHMKSSILITHENCEGSISLTRRTRNLRRPYRMLARNWKHQWLPLCLARSSRTIRIWWLVVNPIRSNWERMPSWRRSKNGPMKKPKLDNARRLRGVYFIDPEDKEFKENHWECSQEIGNADGSRCALQDMQEKQECGDP